MEANSTKQQEKEFIDRIRFITVAILATSVSILITFLQIEIKTISQQYAVLLFAIGIPYFVCDVYFLNQEKRDGITEKKIFSALRIIFWLIGGIAIALSFNGLKNPLNYSTSLIFGISLISFTALRFLSNVIDVRKEMKNKKRDEK